MATSQTPLLISLPYAQTNPGFLFVKGNGEPYELGFLVFRVYLVVCYPRMIFQASSVN